MCRLLRAVPLILIVLAGSTPAQHISWERLYGYSAYDESFDVVAIREGGFLMVGIDDVIYLIAYIFGGGPAPSPLRTGDCDCNEIVNISDAVYLVAYVFGGGLEPCAGCP